MHDLSIWNDENLISSALTTEYGRSIPSHTASFTMCSENPEPLTVGIHFYSSVQVSSCVLPSGFVVVLMTFTFGADPGPSTFCVTLTSFTPSSNVVVSVMFVVVTPFFVDLCSCFEVPTALAGCCEAVETISRIEKVKVELRLSVRNVTS